MTQNTISLREIAKPGAFLLHSGDAGTAAFPAWGGQSYFGCDPFLVFESSGGRSIIQHRGEGAGLLTQEPPLDTLDRLLEKYGFWGSPRLPSDKTVAVLALSYEFGEQISTLPVGARWSQRSTAEQTPWPEIWLGLYDRYTCMPSFPCAKKPAPAPRGILEEIPLVTSNFSRAGYEEAVREILQLIRAGELYQANLAQRFKLDWPQGDWDHALFMALLESNPSPFSAFLRLDPRRTLISLSPERFLSIAAGEILTQPIKGTTRRGLDPRGDEESRRQLWESAKNRAELTMIVDLERNDLGKVCLPGSVKARSEPELKSFPAVHHLVGEVRGELAQTAPFSAVLKACFPGGSVTGAPKIRAMQLIRQLEPVPRGIFTGAVGLIRSNQCLDLNVAIRTFMRLDEKIYLHAGAGIVADSSPAAEYDETLAKVRPLLHTAVQLRKTLEKPGKEDLRVVY